MASKRRIRLVKTACMMALTVTMGLMDVVPGATLMDLKDIINVGYQQISQVYVTKSVGYMIGGISGGAICDRYPHLIDLFLGLELALYGISFALVPWVKYMPLVDLSFICNGASEGAMSATANTYMLMMWGERASGVLQVIFSGGSVGKILGPMLVEPFLSTRNDSMRNISDVLTYGGHNDSSGSGGTSDSRIQIPYGLCGGMSLISAAAFILLFCIKAEAFLEKNIESKSILETFNPKTCLGDRILYGSFIIILVFLLFLGIVGKDISFKAYLFPLAVESSLQFSKASAALLLTLISAAGMLGQFLVALLSTCTSVSLPTLFFLQVLICIGALVCIAISHLQNNVTFWIMALLYGFSNNPQFAFGIAWMNKYMKISAVAVAVPDLAVSTAGLVFFWLSGYLYEHKPKIDTIICSLGCAIFSFVVLFIAQIAVSCHRDQTEDNSQPEDNEDEAIVTSGEENQDAESDTTPLIVN